MTQQHRAEAEKKSVGKVSQAMQCLTTNMLVGIQAWEVWGGIANIKGTYTETKSSR